MFKNIKEYIYGTKIWNKLYFGKNHRELKYWQKNIQRMVRWYDGKEDYYFPNPTNDEKISDFDINKNAIMTYTNAYFKFGSYLKDLRLSEEVFGGQKVADIGCGPLPTLKVFKNCNERYCVDHLIDDYAKIGYPQELYI